ncbi:Ammonium transporter OS=Tsukamurella paurometabola (strain ATCC 8368 / DSM / CCUG 35730 / CIP 100753 / JCM 10117 / KCTC 9821 / NBRC 16120 / NCIMB 702349/ NCTC 13040) OX=521096 GN=Tpau_1608 PE=3 SV=1 [Tsukamurella paurometabola]|uniref:Ammonium transporter n=2 Tax=Tsukamurella paurometabola TaxID=2061 RepID=D5UYC2_TSUPD|nr:ammonium transporter [Tsukamurella paurometabola DSM 20162]SUP30775.1 Ammonia transporter [Tsukamurella paurometabola]
MLLASVPDELFGKVDTGTTAWMLMSAALVLLMTPALAFFYGGLSRQKSVLNMMMMSVGSLGVVSVIYVLWGYSTSFSGEGNYLGLFDNPFTYFGLDQLTQTKEVAGETQYVLSAAGSGLPAIVFAGFQLTFAVITVALISGALAERVKFGTWLLFTAIWTTIVYLPLAHMVWGGGLLSGKEGGIAAAMFGTTDGAANVAPIDFAGGTVVHINAGIAGLILAIVVGKRLGFGKQSYRPHNIPFVMLGAALLWFGWFGFNAGSAGTANMTAGLAWVNTTAATAAAMLGWLAVEKFRDGHATTVGAASGVVAGLVAVTPACANISPVGAIGLGIVAGVAAAYGVGLKTKFGFDDSLDVVGVHLVAGLIGTISLGFIAKDTGLFYGGDYKQLVVQVVIALVAMAFTAVLTIAIAYALKPLGWRVDKESEADGIDNSEHAETAYDLV